MASSLEWFKFSVDRATTASSNEARIRGIFQSNDGLIKFMFSKTIGLRNSNLAKILATREAFLIFTNSTWCQSYNL